MATASKLLSLSARRGVRRPQAFSSAAERGKYFGPFEVRDGVAIIRLDGPEKMNTLSDGAMAEAEKLWVEHVEPDASIKAAVFISSKSDNFIAGADIQVRTALCWRSGGGDEGKTPSVPTGTHSQPTPARVRAAAPPAWNRQPTEPLPPPSARR